MLFRSHNVSEYLFEILLKPEVWYDILYCVTIPRQVTDWGCFRWKISPPYFWLSWQVWRHTLSADGWMGNGNSLSRLKQSGIKEAPAAATAGASPVLDGIVSHHKSLLEHIIAYVICNCNMQE